MNLARVEHYFSQFLSILERPAGQRELQLYDKQYMGKLYNAADYPFRIEIGSNVKFIGTVNVDETTFHFSDKVLDRANVIELAVLNYATEWEDKSFAAIGKHRSGAPRITKSCSQRTVFRMNLNCVRCSGMYTAPYRASAASTVRVRAL